jgi:Na+-transporting NADH:ubiquinone oxidoreductase subunit F
MDFGVLVAAVGAFVGLGMALAALILWARTKLIVRSMCKIEVNKGEKTFEVEGGGTLLAALLQKEIRVPSPCGGKATCRQCRVRVLSGGTVALDPERAVFRSKELKEGWRLSCQCKVKGDLKIELPEELLDVKTFTATVISNENVATFIKELVVESSIDLPYLAGAYLQFTTKGCKLNTGDWKKGMDEKFWPDWERFGLFGHEIEVPEGVVRAYSMASFPAEGRRLKFNIRIATPPIVGGKVSEAPWGICSSYAFGLKKGDELELSGPYGESFMKGGDQEVIFLIGGAGSSFGRSHILHLFRTEKTNRKVSLWYGARSLKENIYEKEYRALAKEFPHFSYHLVLSEPLPSDQWREDDPIKKNFLFKAFELGRLKTMEAPEDALYYVCGPPLHNQSVMKLLDDYGVPREQIVLDDFGS